MDRLAYPNELARTHVVEGGMKPLARALRLFGRERGLWLYALRPMLWGLAAYAAVALLLLATLVPLGRALASSLGIAGGLGGTLGGAIGLGLGIAFGGPIYLGLVALISGFGFDRLSQEAERREFGASAGHPLGFAAVVGDGVARAVLAGALGLVALCGSGTLVVPWLVASLLCLLDFTAPSLLRRGVGLGRQLGVARRLRGALPFALVSGALVLIPVVNVLALPILVAAGTILVAEGDRGASSQEASPALVPPASSRRA